jgi:hypothetical protein
MEYNDLVYGPHEITEPVLLELMQTRAMRRLQNVLQHGITALLGITRSTSRFEHSLGVMFLAQQMGAGLEEQIAALLHDVSHTAFSHVIDYVFGGHDSQSYHEEMKSKYIAASDIPEVLERYGYDWQRLLDEERYPILEQPSPHLCADRLDYFLRDSLGLGLATKDETESALEHLVTREGRIGVDDLPAARWIGTTFIAADRASWANFREVGLYELAAQAIRSGLHLGVLSEEDLWSDDRRAWAKLTSCPDAQLQAQLGLVSTQTRFVWDEADPTFWVSTKLRTVDPDVWINGSFHPLSALDPGFAQSRLVYLSQKSGKWPMRVIPPAYPSSSPASSHPLFPNA